MAMKRWFRVQKIGVVLRPDDPGGEDNTFFDPGHESTIEIDERWADGLDGIEEFSHVVVLFYLDRMPRRRTAGQRRAADDAPDAMKVGFFSTRTPKRPNPIGLSCPRLLRREGNRLIVRGLDAWHGTPVIDIKGYYPRDEGRPDATVPEWLAELWRHHDDERGAPFRPY
jgi:tRNA-Thr(GGU) m(6)t(6)A37 methyltransferase TsaA